MVCILVPIDAQCCSEETEDGVGIGGRGGRKEERKRLMTMPMAGGGEQTYCENW